MAKKTLVQARDRAETTDANRAFASIVSASGGDLELIEGDMETVRKLLGDEKKIWIDQRIFGRRAPPQLFSSLTETEVFIIPPAVDSRIRLLKEQPREEDVIRLITPLEITSENGLADALPLLKELSDSGVAWHWYLLGRPGSERFFESFVHRLEKLDVADDITMVGEYSLEKYLKLAMNMDYAYFPGLEEGLGITMIEALAMGLPILAKRKPQWLHAEDDSFFVYEDMLKDRNDVLNFLRGIEGAEFTRRAKRDLTQLPTWKGVAEKLLAQC